MRTAANVARVVAIVLSVMFGLLLVLIAFAVGDCSAFGGTCPQDPPPLLEDDTFGTAAAGAALAVGVPVFLTSPSWRRLGIAVLAALAAGVLIGLMARSSSTS